MRSRSPAHRRIAASARGAANEVPLQCANPQSATVELRHGDQVREGATDDLGRFSFSDVPVGPIQLSVESPSGGKVVTEWMVA